MPISNRILQHEGPVNRRIHLVVTIDVPDMLGPDLDGRYFATLRDDMEILVDQGLEHALAGHHSLNWTVERIAVEGVGAVPDPSADIGVVSDYQSTGVDLSGTTGSEGVSQMRREPDVED